MNLSHTRRYWYKKVELQPDPPHDGVTLFYYRPADDPDVEDLQSGMRVLARVREEKLPNLDNINVVTHILLEEDDDATTD